MDMIARIAVTHGALVAAATLVAAGGVGVWRGPRWAARWRGRRARASRDALGAVERGAVSGDGREHTLDGVLVCDAPAGELALVTRAFGLRADGGSAPPRSWCAPGLALERDGRRLRLGPDALLVAGDEAAVGVDPGEDPEGAPRVRDLSARVGARVRVRAVATADLDGAGHGGYRDGGAVRLTAGAAGAVLVASCEDPVAPRAWAVRAGAAAACVAAVALAQLGAGVTLLSRAVEGRGEIAHAGERALCDGRGVTSAAYAAMSLPVRARALTELSSQLLCRRARSRETVDDLDRAYAAAHVPCEAHAETLARMHAYPRAAKRYAQCGTAEAWVSSAWLWSGLGDFGRAADALRRGQTSLGHDDESAVRAARVYLLAGDVARAEPIVRGLADRAQARAERDAGDGDAPTLYCLADGLKAQQGDVVARARLVQRLRGDERPFACWAMLADLPDGLAAAWDSLRVPTAADNLSGSEEAQGDVPFTAEAALGANASYPVLRPWGTLTAATRALFDADAFSCSLRGACAWREGDVALGAAALTVRALEMRVLTAMPSSLASDGGRVLALDVASLYASAGDRASASAWLQRAGDVSTLPYNANRAAGRLQATVAGGPSWEAQLVAPAAVSIARAVERGVAPAAARNWATLTPAQRVALLPTLTTLTRAQCLMVMAEAVRADPGVALAVRDQLATEDAWLNVESPSASWRAAAARLPLVEALHDRALADETRGVVRRFLAVATGTQTPVALRVIDAL